MVRKLVFVLLFIVAGSGWTACLDRLDSLRIVSLRQAGLNTSGNQRINEAAANLYVNIAIQKISSDFPAVIKHRSFQLTEYNSIYLIDTLFDSLFSCVLKDTVGGVRRALRKISNELDWELMIRGKIQPEDTVETTFPPQYVMVAGDSLKIYPPPTYNDYLEITYSVIGTKLLHDTLKTDIRPAYRDLITLWAAYLMFVERGLFEEAAFLRAEYDARYLKERRVVQPWELAQ